jgi:membrane protein required for colicin V production
MNWLDIAVIGVVLLSAVFAFARGFVREALSIVAWVGAAAITLYGFNRAFALVDPHVHNVLLSQVIAGFGLFVVSLVILTIVTGFLARGAFLVCLAYLLLDLTLPQQSERPEWIRDAKSAPYLHEGADLLKGFLPESLKTKSADDMIKTLSPKALAKDAMDALAKPTLAPVPGQGAATPPNYSLGEKKDLDRLIGTQQQR